LSEGREEHNVTGLGFAFELTMGVYALGLVVWYLIEKKVI
jgi:hypothetical protein